MKQTNALVAVVSLTIGVASGFYAGYKYAGKKFDAELEVQVAEAKDFYAKANKSGMFATPEGAAEALGVVGEEASENLDEAIKALREYQGETSAPRMIINVDGDISDEESAGIRSVFDKPGFTPTPSDDHPYVITLEDWMDNPFGHDQLQLTWYEGDRVLADDREEPVEQIEKVIGYENLENFGLSDPNEEHIVLIRNTKTKSDYEIARSTGKYAHEVLGLEEELKHSDERRRGRPQWDD